MKPTASCRRFLRWYWACIKWPLATSIAMGASLFMVLVITAINPHLERYGVWASRAFPHTLITMPLVLCLASFLWRFREFRAMALSVVEGQAADNSGADPDNTVASEHPWEDLE